MIIKAKRTDVLEKKLITFINKIVVNFLNKKGYECDTSMESMRKVNSELNAKGLTVILDRKNERISKIGSYYTWEGFIKVKIIDKITGKEK